MTQPVPLMTQPAPARGESGHERTPAPAMALPGLADWIFSAKTFAAAMVAFYVALAVNLDRPYWCIATVYVVSQPFAGAMRAKGVYRICGTVVGAAAAIVLVPNLVDAPVLLTGALCLWLGLCLYLSLADRTPRAYLFMLAGYTAAIIGFPSVDTPGQIFEIAQARVEEIGLGIISATVIGSIVLPRPTASVLDAHMAGYFAAARRWATAVLTGARDEEAMRAARHAMAGAPAQFDTLISNLAHDTSQQYAARVPAAVLGARLTYLLPVVSQVAAHASALEQAGGLNGELRALLQRIANYLGSGPDTPPEAGRKLRAELGAAMPATDARQGWTGLVTAALLTRLAEFVAVVQDIRALRRQVVSAHPRLPALELPRGIGPDATRYRDHAMALLSSLTAMLAVALICTFWIVTEWPEGAIAALMTAILCSFFSTLDDPVPQIVAFLVDIIVGFFVSAAYLFVILPRVVDFAGLALVLAPFYIVFGAFPRTRSMALNATMMMTLTAYYDSDFAGFINSSLASAAGIATAALVTALVRSVGADVTARRLKRACRRDVARAAARPLARPAFAARFLDRIVALAPRLAGPDADARLQTALRDLNIGLAVTELQRRQSGLSPAIDANVAATLVLLGEHYRRSEPQAPPPELSARLDAAITAAVDRTEDAASLQLAKELLGLRLNLFPDAPILGPAPGDRRSAP